MALPQNTTHISDFPTTSEVTPEDYVPVVRKDTDATFGNYKTKARNFISYPYGYLKGGDLILSGSTYTIGVTYCRDSQGLANIFIEEPITKTIDANLFYPSGVPAEDGVYYVVVARKSESDTTSTFFFTKQKGGALGTSWAYSRAVAIGSYSASTKRLSGVWCYDNEIVSVQKNEVTAGSPLANGKIVLVVEPL